MLIACQFPIADVRGFAEPMLRTVAQPDWDTPFLLRPGKDFVRCFGPVGRRIKGSSSVFPDDGFYAQGLRAVRYHRLEKHWVGPPGNRFKPFGAFRRLFPVSSPAVRFELGVSNRTYRREYPVRGCDGGQLLRIVTDFMELPVQVKPYRAEAIDQPLWMIGDVLAELYASATAKGRASSAAVPLVTATAPMILVEYQGDEVAALPPWTREIEPDLLGGAELAFFWLRYRRREFGVWLLRSDSAPPERVRDLRLLVMRLHGERQTLKQVLRLIRAKELPYAKKSVTATPLGEYLSRSGGLLSKNRQAGFDSSAIADVLNAYDALVDPHERTQLEKLLTELLPDVTAFEEPSKKARIEAAGGDEDVKGESIDVFVCYSHKDGDICQELLDYLEFLVLEDKFVFWSDHKIGTGDEWRQEINQGLKKADLALVLVSQPVLTSKFIRDVEVPGILHRSKDDGLRILPVLVSACSWERVPWIEKRQLRPRNETLRRRRSRDRRAELFKEILDDLSSAAKELREQRKAG